MGPIQPDGEGWAVLVAVGRSDGGARGRAWQGPPHCITAGRPAGGGTVVKTDRVPAASDLAHGRPKRRAPGPNQGWPLKPSDQSSCEQQRDLRLALKQFSKNGWKGLPATGSGWPMQVFPPLVR